MVPDRPVFRRDRSQTAFASWRHRSITAVERLESRNLLAVGGMGGDLDTTFDTDGLVNVEFEDARNEQFDAVVVQNDGKIVVAGTSSIVGGADRDMLVARFNTDGSVDTTFGTSGFVRIDFNGEEMTARDVLLDSSGNIIVVGEIGRYSSTHLAAVRLNSSGVLDTSFDSDSNDDIDDPNTPAVNDGYAGLAMALVGTTVSPTQVNAAAGAIVNAAGEIVVVGTTNFSFTFNEDIVVARFDSGGQLVSGFDGDGIVVTNVGGTDDSNDKALAVATDASGNFVVAGSSDPTIGLEQVAVLRYQPDGSLDTSFDSDGIVTSDFSLSSRIHRAQDVALQADGKILIGGFSSETGSNNDSEFLVARYLSTGALDTTFNPNGDAGTAGNGDPDVPGSIRIEIVKDPNTGVEFKENEGTSIAIQQDGSIVVGGIAYDSDDLTTTRFALVRIVSDGVSDGTLDASFGDSGTVASLFTATKIHVANDVAIQPDGQILAAGHVEVPVVNPSGFEFQVALARYDSGLGGAPVADAGGPYNVDEGSSIVLDGSATTDDTPATLLYEWDLDGNLGNGFEASGVGLTAPTFDASLLDGPDSVVVTLRVTDECNLVHEDTATVTIDNADPTADAGGPYETISDETIMLSGSGTDPAGANDPLTFEWDFDGNLATVEAVGQNPVFDPVALGITATEVRAVTLTVSDGDGGVAMATADVRVFGLGPSVVDDTLFVIGSLGADNVVVRINGGLIEVQNDIAGGGIQTFDPADVVQIEFVLRDGDDIAIVENNVAIPVQIDGGAGDDFLVGGSVDDLLIGGTGIDLLYGRGGDDVLLGNEGDDDLLGGSGDDVIIGGDGEDLVLAGSGQDLLIGGNDLDWLLGNSGDDIAIGGTSIYDQYDATSVAAIDQAMDIWTSGDPYDDRVDALVGDGLFLDAGVTVFDDGVSDVIFGGSGRDLYAANTTIDDPDADFLIFANPFEEVVET